MVVDFDYIECKTFASDSRFWRAESDGKSGPGAIRTRCDEWRGSLHPKLDPIWILCSGTSTLIADAHPSLGGRPVTSRYHRLAGERTHPE